MTNGAEGLIRKKDEGLTQQGLWMVVGKLLMCSFLWEERGQGPGVRECRAINGKPPSGSPESSAGLGMLMAVRCVHLFMLALFHRGFNLALGKHLA